MKILLADSDRDMLMCFQKLITLSGREVMTAFDGTQVVNLLAGSRFDLVILNDRIPRVRSSEIIKHLNEEDIPVIVILENKVNAKLLTDEVLANAYLPLPFLPNELLTLIEEVSAKHATKKKLVFADMEVDVAGFKLGEQQRITNEEIAILEALLSEQTFNAKRAGPYINSLNHKFEKLRKKVHIRYVMGKGYGLVTNVMQEV